MATSEIQTPSGRDRAADVLVVVNFILRRLYTWALPADFGVDYGYEMGSFNGPVRGNARSYTSAEEILAELGITPESVGGGDDIPDDALDNWPPEPYADYARALWLEVGVVLRARGAPPAEPPVRRFRPPWADRRSLDGRLVLIVPDELIPFVGTDTAELAANEVTYMTGAVHAYDRGKVSAGIVQADFDIRMALWRERKRVADLLGRTE